MKTLLLTVLVCFTLCLTTCAQTPRPTTGQVVRIDSRLDKLIPKEATIEVLASGFTWAEGPIWVKDGGYLLFSDVPQTTIFKWSFIFLR